MFPALPFIARLGPALLFIVLTLLASASVAQAPSAQTPSAPLPSFGGNSVSSVALYPTEGFNLVITEREGNIITLAPATKGAAHNWFAGLFTELPVGREITLRINMKGQHTQNRADVKKWKGLRPVMSYADPNAPATYFTYTQREDGVWESDNPFAAGRAREAGNGATPRQNVMAPQLAPLFLSEETRMQQVWVRDTKSKDPRKGSWKTQPVKVQTWSAWRELENVEADTENNHFVIRESFALPHATVAMRVPFLPVFHEWLGEQLSLVRVSHLRVEKLGTSPSGKFLLGFRVEDQNARESENKRKPTILLTAREHATEHASSWALYGLLIALLEDSEEGREMRDSANWLLLPLQDPEGATSSTFARMTESFRDPYDPKTPPEVWPYTRWLRDYTNEGRTIDAAIAIHNVESDEAANLTTPFTDNVHIEATDYINKELFPFVKKEGFAVGGALSGHIGASPWRLYGWTALRFGALPIAYEVNDRWPRNRLSHAGLQRLGARLGLGFARWAASERGQKWHRGANTVLLERDRAREAAWAEKGAPTLGSQREKVELLMKGF